MTHYEFQPFHNWPITFRLKNGTILKGLLFDKFSNRYWNQSDTTYQFTKNTYFEKFQTASQANDLAELEKLSSKIDIKEIVWAERISLNF